MRKRSETRPVYLGSLQLGGQEEVLIQSMCSIKTSKVDLVVPQIQKCAAYGAKLMRLSVLDEEDARAFKRIKERVSLPLVADIHIDYRLALLSLENGVDAIRINPGNIGSEERLVAVLEAAKRHHAPIRVGVNGGSLDKSIYSGRETIKGKALFESAKKHVGLLEKHDFHDIVISLKGSDALETISAYRLASDYFPYPLHLGVTEAGPMEVSLIRSTAALAPLLLDGIGDTIRISLTEDPVEEVKAASRLLHDLSLLPAWPTFISCPTCGRTEVDLVPLAKRVMHYLEEHHIHKTVAIMGCIVNGPGEGKHADIGLAGGKGKWVLFKKGVPLYSVQDEEAYDTLIKEIEND